MYKLIDDIRGNEAGGKARGLKILRDLGLRVPGAVVLVHPEEDTIDPALLAQWHDMLGPGPKAVRSSAMSEDGSEHSFAGQFETFLDLHTGEEIAAAVGRCMEAAGAGRVKAYAESRGPGADLRISVIIQQMVVARAAGVVFSANPVTHRRDRVIINAVAGHGEALVSGRHDAHHYELNRSGSNIAEEGAKNGYLLHTSHLAELLEGTLKAEKHLKMPVDLEWAIDHDGQLHWLQLRPITTLDEVHYNELDSESGPSEKVWTLGNIGEMMPGTATPLTWSVSAEAIDYGMTMLADRAGAFRLSDRTTPRYIQMFYNRLFINMSHMMDYPKRVWLNTPEDVQFALSGKVFPGVSASPEAPFIVRFTNFIRQIINTSRGGKHLSALRRLEAGFRIDYTLPARELYNTLGEARHRLGIGFGHHLGTSAQSGTLYSAFMRIMTAGKRMPEPADHHLATLLLLNIPDIESADAVKSLERFVAIIQSDREFSSVFTKATPEEALSLLMSGTSPAVTETFSRFLERHGHRCVRESELRECTWGEHPMQLMAMLQTRAAMAPPHHPKPEKTTSSALPRHIPFIQRMILRSIVTSARKAVARREISKGLSIKMVDTMRKGYRQLGTLLAGSGLLDDDDQVYFLLHEEIGELLTTRDPVWKEKASKRRKLLPELDRLVFDEVSHGIPEPIEQEPVIAQQDGSLKGIPVSRGVTEGAVRIVNSLEEASTLREGEIMVASFTDIGWTPWFSVIGGLITEIGSPLSHGAVVAREYGIPAVVSVKGARKLLSNGEIIRLDGEKGTVERV